MSSNLTSSVTVRSQGTCEAVSIVRLHVPCSGLSTRCLCEWMNSPAIRPCQRTQFNPPPGLVTGLLRFLFVLYVTVVTATFFRATVCGLFVSFVSSAKLPFVCRGHPWAVTLVCWSIQCHCEKPPPYTLQNARYKDPSAALRDTLPPPDIYDNPIYI